MISPDAFIHPKALVDEGVAVGAGTRVWAFAHLVRGAFVGEDCNICDHTFIEGKVRVGNRVTIKSGVQLWDGTHIEDDVFIGPNATFTNDRTPRSRKTGWKPLGTNVQRFATIGANATILPGLAIGRGAMVSAGAVVTRDVPDHALMIGNPARRRGWVCLCGETLRDGLSCQCGQRYKRNVNGLVPVS